MHAEQERTPLLLQGYVFLLLRQDASLLGLGYLSLLIATFLNPPIRGRFVETDDFGRVVNSSESGISRVYRGVWSPLGNLLLFLPVIM